MSDLDPDKVDDVVEHFGRIGMHWGVRTQSVGGNKQTTGPENVTVKVADGRGVRGVSGGGKHPASQDAIRLAGLKQTVKASTLHSLSNKEIQEAVTRMNLEKQYIKLTPQKGVKAWVKAFFKSDTGKKEAKGLATGEWGPITKNIGVKLAVGAVTAQAGKKVYTTAGTAGVKKAAAAGIGKAAATAAAKRAAQKAAGG